MDQAVKVTEYVQLRRASETEWDTFWYRSDPQRKRMVQQVADALFKEWFPGFPETGPKDEDLDNWRDIAYSDAEVAVMALVRGAWIDDPTMD
jgi:hypothetical protein